MAERPERPSKIAKVQQNHSIVITHVDNSSPGMDHYCNVIILPDRLNPAGLTKRGIKIGLNEFRQGCKILGERCSYRLLTPLSNFAYAAYLHKATEDFLRNGNGDPVPSRPVLQVSNQSPFRYKSRSFVCGSCSGVLQVFELFADVTSEPGFAKQVEIDELPFLINWCGPDIKSMAVDDKACLRALVKMISALDDLQPSIEGLGLCILAEFGRFLCYNLMVDEDQQDINDADTESESESDDLMGYKQLILVLQSQCVETGKSFFCELLSRIFHGRKQDIHSVLSFESAKVMLSKGQPVIIDDYMNDSIGSTLLSRASKSIWAKSIITIRGQSTTPNSNLLLCTNENIRDLKVEGHNKEEIFMKMSVVDLGETPMSSSNPETKAELRKEVIEQSKVIRKFLPSFFGLISQICGKYITSDEFKYFCDVTRHERLANLLKNVGNLYNKLNKFCEEEGISKPESLESDLNTTCLTNKSVLAFKTRSPEQIAEYLIKSEEKFVVTTHESKEGIAFESKNLTKFSWYKDSFNAKQDGVKVFHKMRTRLLHPNKKETLAAFLCFGWLKPVLIDKLKTFAVNKAEDDPEYILDDLLTDEIVPVEVDPKAIIENHFDGECREYERVRMERITLVEQYILALKYQNSDNVKTKLKCDYCKFVAKSKSGLTNHLKKCRSAKNK